MLAYTIARRVSSFGRRAMSQNRSPAAAGGLKKSTDNVVFVPLRVGMTDRRVIQLLL